MVFQLDLLQEGGLPRDVKVMGSGLHTGLHHSLPVESNKKDRNRKRNAQLFTGNKYGNRHFFDSSNV
jgi:hypothetical protein